MTAKTSASGLFRPASARRLLAPLSVALGVLGLVLHASGQMGDTLSPGTSARPSGPAPRCGWVQIHSEIQPASAGYLDRNLDWAEDESLMCLVIELDTPGGLDSSMRQMVKRILNARIPVVVYVAPPGARAASAGVFLTLAAHVAAMAPSTNIGAAHPVAIGGGLGGEGQADTTMIGKVVNDAVAYIRSVAEQRDRNPDWAESAVRRSVSVSASEALDLGVIDIIAEDSADLLAQLDGRTVSFDSRTTTLRTANVVVLRRDPNLRDEILNVIANPNVAYLLLLLGGLGLFFEFSHPGTLFPGIVGGLCLLLAFFGLQMLPVRAAGIALIALAIILFVLEIKVTSYGALAIGGVAALLFGSLMLFERGPGGVRLALDVILPSVAVVAALFIFGVVMAARAQRIRTKTGREGMVGEVGVAQNALAPEGQVFVHGELWRARSRIHVARSARVRVVAVEGLMLIVEPAEEEV